MSQTLCDLVSSRHAHLLAMLPQWQPPCQTMLSALPIPGKYQSRRKFRISSVYSLDLERITIAVGVALGSLALFCGIALLITCCTWVKTSTAASAQSLIFVSVKENIRREFITARGETHRYLWSHGGVNTPLTMWLSTAGCHRCQGLRLNQEHSSLTLWRWVKTQLRYDQYTVVVPGSRQSTASCQRFLLSRWTLRCSTAERYDAARWREPSIYTGGRLRWQSRQWCSESGQWEEWQLHCLLAAMRITSCWGFITFYLWKMQSILTHFIVMIFSADWSQCDIKNLETNLSMTSHSRFYD